MSMPPSPHVLSEEACHGGHAGDGRSGIESIGGRSGDDFRDLALECGNDVLLHDVVMREAEPAIVVAGCALRGGAAAVPVQMQ